MSDTKSTICFNQIIGAIGGTFEPRMIVTIFESWLANFFQVNGIDNESQNS